MPIDELPNPTFPVCIMCRAAMHKHCERKEGKVCTCDCARGY